jgi:predicted metal-dependent TIM-barrel fold hydrolase
MKTLNYIKLNESGVANVVSALHRPQRMELWQTYHEISKRFHLTADNWGVTKKSVVSLQEGGVPAGGGGR